MSILDWAAAMWAKMARVDVANARQAVLVSLVVCAVIVLSTFVQTLVEDMHYDAAAQRAWDQRAMILCHIDAIVTHQPISACPKGGR